MTVSTFADFKICLDDLSSLVYNVTLMVKGMVVGPQSHYEGPPTVGFGHGLTSQFYWDCISMTGIGYWNRKTERA